MAQFTPNVPVATTAPTVEVTVNPTQPLPVGRQHFRLVVTDDSGNVSQPDEVVIIVADRERPTAVLRAPTTVNTGQSFTLDGTRSFDVGGGKIVKWEWTYLGPQT